VRRPYVAGNWKMNLDRRGARDLAAAVRERADGAPVDVALFPPFVYLSDVAELLRGSTVVAGAQDASAEAEGAFTGEVSAAMVADVGARAALAGHSERRHIFGEDDALVGRKLARILAAGLQGLLCVGETLEERQAGDTERVVAAQLRAGLSGVPAAQLGNVCIAYEPVWAIGTGHTATPEQAGEVHSYLRGVLSGLYDAPAAERLRILYGGSVKPDNVQDLMAVPDIDGALVGGASLDPHSFLAIVEFGK